MDITGESYEIIDVKGQKKQKTCIRPNVALELGMSYGFGKPVFILSRKINGRHEIPTDIQFVRYIDISPQIPTIELMGWEGASQKILDSLRETLPLMNSNRLNIMDQLKIPKDMKQKFESIIKFKEKIPYLENKNFQINQIILKNESLVCIVKDASELFEGVLFKLYVEEDGLEEFVGIIENYHVRPDGIAQLNILSLDANWNFQDKVKKACVKEGKYIPEKHRLELIIPEEIKTLKLKDLKNITKQL